MRLFIAIKLNSELRNALTDVQQRLIRRGIRGNYTNTDNLHITLAFIGEYDEPDFVTEVISEVPFSPFPISLSTLGHFGNLWWVGLDDNDELDSYVKRLRKALSEAGIPFDKKKFSPHITLIRKAIGTLPAVSVPKTVMSVDHISLMSSKRGTKGMIYTEIGRN
jgi:2'-5' RNA ligase